MPDYTQGRSVSEIMQAYEAEEEKAEQERKAKREALTEKIKSFFPGGDGKDDSKEKSGVLDKITGFINGLSDGELDAADVEKMGFGKGAAAIAAVGLGALGIGAAVNGKDGEKEQSEEKTAESKTEEPATSTGTSEQTGHTKSKKQEIKEATTGNAEPQGIERTETVSAYSSRQNLENTFVPSAESMAEMNAKKLAAYNNGLVVKNLQYSSSQVSKMSHADFVNAADNGLVPRSEMIKYDIAYNNRLHPIPIRKKTIEPVAHDIDLGKDNIFTMADVQNLSAQNTQAAKSVLEQNKIVQAAVTTPASAMSQVVQGLTNMAKETAKTVDKAFDKATGMTHDERVAATKQLHVKSQAEIQRENEGTSFSFSSMA